MLSIVLLKSLAFSPADVVNSRSTQTFHDGSHLITHTFLLGWAIGFSGDGYAQGSSFGG
jgi:hypothetical protein